MYKLGRPINEKFITASTAIADAYFSRTLSPGLYKIYLHHLNAFNSGAALMGWVKLLSDGSPEAAFGGMFANDSIYPLGGGTFPTVPVNTIRQTGGIVKFTEGYCSAAGQYYSDLIYVEYGIGLFIVKGAVTGNWAKLYLNAVPVI